VGKGGEPRNRWGMLMRELEIKEHEMRLLDEQVMGSTVHVRPSLTLLEALRIDFVLFWWC
jgi:hypothetical protein